MPGGRVLGAGHAWAGIRRWRCGAGSALPWAADMGCLCVLRSDVLTLPCDCWRWEAEGLRWVLPCPCRCTLRCAALTVLCCVRCALPAGH